MPLEQERHTSAAVGSTGATPPSPRHEAVPISLAAISADISGDIMSNDEIAPCLSVVMPVYNEEGTVASVIQKVLAQRPVQELIVVDDCSKDGTWQVLQGLERVDKRLRLVRHENNQGKGAALRTGFRHASAPVVIIQDADFEYSPAEYHLVLAPILTGKADVVYGSRFIGSGAHRVLYYWHSVGNKFLTTLSNMATNLNLTDMETCYKTFRREVIEKITIEENRFGFEPEITAKISKLKLRVYEVAISYHGRTYEEGKKINWRDGFSALRCILKYNLLR
jgi:glycosyltransferase involved in cell wall biosynthesis